VVGSNKSKIDKLWFAEQTARMLRQMKPNSRSQSMPLMHARSNKCKLYPRAAWCICRRRARSILDRWRRPQATSDAALQKVRPPRLEEKMELKDMREVAGDISVAQEDGRFLSQYRGGWDGDESRCEELGKGDGLANNAYLRA
jgi:hypothetical protein